jgi:t-SNARE complex subunit (syntaxin)
LKSNQDKLLKERQEKAELEVSLKTSSVQVENFISEITNLQEKIKEEIE